MKNQKGLIKMFILFFLLQIFFLCSMILVYLLPNRLIEDSVKDGMYYLNNYEGKYPLMFFYEDGAVLDNSTDSLMLETAVQEGNNPLDKAMVPTYSRYWHGYQLYLRPLLTGFNYAQIRYFVYIFSMLLFAVSFYCVAKHINMLTGILWAFSILLSRFCIVSVSLQYVSCFNIMFMTVIWLCLYHKSYIAGKKDIYILFLIVGAVTNFIDFLTVPMLTLGAPLIVYLLMIMKSEDYHISKGIKKVILCSVSWCCAYGFTWIFKWLIGTVILKQNVLDSAVSQGVFRVAGNEEYPLNRALMYQSNIKCLLGTTGGILFVSILIVWLIFMICSRKPWKECFKIAPVLLLSLYPYIWYGFMANHSQIHAMFTYRLQIIAVFSLLASMGYCIDTKKLKRWIS